MAINTNKRELSKYELKIKELQGLVAEKAKSLSDIDGRYSAVQSQISKLSESKERLENLLLSLNCDLKEIEDKIIIRRKEFDELIEPRQRIVDKLNTECKCLEKTLNGLHKDFISKSDKYKKSIVLQEKKINDNEKKIKKLTLEIDKIGKEKQKIESFIVQESNKLIKDKKEVEESMAKNGRILTQTENNLRLLEHYVKRLQRYYNEHNIKLNILNQFGIK